jgi:hypothetical protein
MLQMPWLAEIGNDPVVTARRAELLGALRQDQPVADVVNRVRAIAVWATWVCQRGPCIAAGLERGYGVSRSGKYPSASPQLSHCVFSKYNGCAQFWHSNSFMS